MKPASRAVRSAALGLFVAALAACRPPPHWETLTESASSWLLAVTATESEAIAVGGSPGGPGSPGQGHVVQIPTAGGAATELSSPQPGMLWWIHALTPQVAWLCGEGGSVLRLERLPDGGSRLAAVPTDVTSTLYGIVALSDQDVWAVGGDEGSPGVVLHGDQTRLRSVTGLPATGVLYKLYAADPTHLYAVGSGGLVLEKRGDAWTLSQAPTRDRLLTVHGSGADRVWAVGGLAQARLLRLLPGELREEAGSTAADGVDLEALAGLWVDPAQIFVSGQRGRIASRRDGATGFTVESAPTTLDLHALFRGGDTLFAAGGNLSQYRLSPPRGVLLKRVD